jgi:Secretion system C-terminal sorting domain
VLHILFPGLPTCSIFLPNFSGLLLGQLMAVDTMIGSAVTYDPSTLLSTATAITPASNIESNLQTTAQIHLQAKVAKTRKLAGSQINTLIALANKCPSFDGIGVYQARVLLAYYNANFTPYGIAYCDGNRHEHHKLHTNNGIDSVKNISFNLYPNPNSGSFTITYNIGDESSGRVEIYSELGVKVGEYFLNSQSGSMKINNSELSQGIYF